MKKNTLIILIANIIFIALGIWFYHYQWHQRLAKQHELSNQKTEVFQRFSNLNHQYIEFAYYTNQSKMKFPLAYSQKIDKACKKTIMYIDELLNQNSENNTVLLQYLNIIIAYPKELFKIPKIQAYYSNLFNNEIASLQSYSNILKVIRALEQNQQVDLFELKLNIASINVDISSVLLGQYSGHSRSRPELIILNNNVYDNDSIIHFDVTLGTIGYNSSFENNYAIVVTELYNKENVIQRDSFETNGILTKVQLINNHNFDSIRVKYLRPEIHKDSMIYYTYKKSLIFK